MQAMDIKRPAVSRIVVATIALAMLTAGAIGLILVNQLDSDGVRQITTPSLLVSAVTQAQDTRTFEQNTELPTGGHVDSATSMTRENQRSWQLEQGIPHDTSGTSRSVEQTLYIEQNTWLPAGDAQSPTVTAEDASNSPIVSR